MVGNTFTNSCPDWKVGTYENFKDWAVRQFGVKELESDDEAEVPVQMQKAKDIVFKRSKKGGIFCPQWAITKPLAKSRGSFEVSLEQFIVHDSINP